MEVLQGFSKEPQAFNKQLKERHYSARNTEVQWINH